ncbi:hypothetical protein LOZ12_002405 [Ophidiomyces ophidiicola]|uniref:Uncharacterized protein n=1 Tax=Ophidiomyces ophidiicola TaxID=1387563 RepID=A0ACB8UYH8_9EURO|nr:hypothetical protein LOZ61_006376 [Ophidiomyces ophidiicola]KAI1918697.1 hypothetical protein LOZ64_002671 [Ophidiomyces ophidiicola]KAI1921847.1 hypothetical protein LOZ60_006059 [Ophidiomyces ophidiicola]KAI1949524.1 hypothetical protein LOZ62_002275 [Ophidiomyces ophidiicola]KAI1957307.1 hypothetical protein LOZ59_003974 [Ophidiomyces ophidiicola]
MASGVQGSNNVIELQGEKQLLEELSVKEPTFRDVNRYLALFQHSCSNVLYRNLDTEFGPVRAAVDTKIWDSRMKINSRFRKLLLQFRDAQARKGRPVEERKLKHQYQRFISGGQQFYEDYLKFILTHACCSPELARAALELRIEVKPPPAVSEDLKRALLDSCYSTFIKLGDFSRYYQVELVQDPEKREWTHVVSYYTLAGSIKPHCGIFHNQLAIIALGKGDHFQAIYYLYRALSATEPHPTAASNLKLEFRKILNSRTGALMKSKDEKESLVSSFVHLHAMCYKGADFPERDELENELLNNMTNQLKENSLDSDFLQRLCLINIAAEAHAQATSGTNGNALFFFQQLNVKMFFTLLQVLLADTEEMSGVISQILPALRNYSSWLVINSHMLVSDAQDTSLGVQTKEFWNIYATTLTLLTSTFPVPQLPYLDYLLQEDYDTLGFSPLFSNGKIRRYVDKEGKPKPKAPHEEDEDRVKTEILFRVREFVIDGLELIVSKKIPIILSNSQDQSIFLCKEDGLPQFSIPPAASIPQDDSHPIQRSAYHSEDVPVTSISTMEDMNDMVDALVNSEEDPSKKSVPQEEKILLQPWPCLSIETNGITTQSPLSTNGALQGRNSPIVAQESPPPYSPRPVLPSIFDSPFASGRSPTATEVGLHRIITYDSNVSPPGNRSAVQQTSPTQKSPFSPPLMSRFSSDFTPTQTPIASYHNYPAINRHIGLPGPNGFGGPSTFNPPVSPWLNLSISPTKLAGIAGPTPPSGQGG